MEPVQAMEPVQMEPLRNLRWNVVGFYACIDLIHNSYVTFLLFSLYMYACFCQISVLVRKEV